MRYMEIDFHPHEITVWVKDEEQEVTWVKTYNVYTGGKYHSPHMVLEIASDTAKKHGVAYIRVLERVGGYAYEWMNRHTAGNPIIKRMTIYNFHK